VATATKRLTGVDVLSRAIQIARETLVLCPYCAIATAKTQLDREGQYPDDVVPMADVLSDVISGAGQEFPGDAALVDARAALKPFREEIVGCPSPVSAARLIDILESALVDAQQLKATKL
jgi:hypothetical protein